jgi:hypothetical protein
MYLEYSTSCLIYVGFKTEGFTMGYLISLYIGQSMLHIIIRLNFICFLSFIFKKNPLCRKLLYDVRYTDQCSLVLNDGLRDLIYMSRGAEIK